jgi:hypothetical protein
MKKTQFWPLAIVCIVIYIVFGAIISQLGGSSPIFMIYVIVGISSLLMASGLYLYPEKPKRVRKTKKTDTDTQTPTKPEETMTKPKGRSMLCKVIIWILAILIIIWILNSIRGVFFPTCQNISEGTSYPNGISLGSGVSCVSLSLNSGEFSPWVYTPIGSRYSFSSPGKPIEVFFGNGSNYYLGINKTVYFGPIGSYFRFQAHQDNTEITVKLR